MGCGARSMWSQEQPLGSSKAKTRCYEAMNLCWAGVWRLPLRGTSSGEPRADRIPSPPVPGTVVMSPPCFPRPKAWVWPGPKDFSWHLLRKVQVTDNDPNGHCNKTDNNAHNWYQVGLWKKEGTFEQGEPPTCPQRFTYPVPPPH